jgi:hypothetical protein
MHAKQTACSIGIAVVLLSLVHVVTEACVKASTAACLTSCVLMRCCVHRCHARALQLFGHKMTYA